MNHHLILTSDERTWKFDRPVLFLGEWCRRYDRRHIWSTMEAEIAEPYGLHPGQKKRNAEYVYSIYKQILFEIVEALNQYHETNHDKRYWTILLGHWLYRYVSVVFNRFSALEQAFCKYTISGTTILDLEGYSLTTQDSLSFIWAVNDDIWNHVLYTKIINFIGKTGLVNDTVGIQKISCFSQVENESRFKRNPSIKKLVYKSAKFIFPWFSRKHDAFIIKSYLPRWHEAKLEISMGQCPQLWQSPPLMSMPQNQEERIKLQSRVKRQSGFRGLVRELVWEMLPVCYLEGYTSLVKQTESLPWPQIPKFIFTSNSFDTDEIFKAWTASKVEQGIPYFTGQHGNNYGTHYLFGSTIFPERSEADKFLTWGWDDGTPNNIPAFILSLANKKLISSNNGGLLLIEVCQPHRLDLEDSYYEFGKYQEDQFRFVRALPSEIRKDLTVRLHSAFQHFNWDDEQRWADFDPLILLEKGAASIISLIAQNRLVVHSYDSTGILETLVSNVPTICFWRGGLEHLLPEAKPYYEILKNAGILADTPEQAAKFVTLHWEDIEAWWLSEKVQCARIAFCEQYARTEKHPIRRMKQLLLTHATKGVI
jgi:putative transferase (TIGR04331 family)